MEFQHTGVALTGADAPDLDVPKVFLLGEELSPGRRAVLTVPRTTTRRAIRDLVNAGFAVRVDRFEHNEGD